MTVRENVFICPDCGGRLKHYDKVKRVIRTKGRDTTWIIIKRVKCEHCHKLHRVLPKDLFPYKQYEAELIRGVLEGYITPMTFGYEDFPSEMTMKRWLKEWVEIDQRKGNGERLADILNDLNVLK